MTQWPLQSNCNNFYGNPRDPKTGGASAKWESANLVSIAPPYRMTYAGKPIKTIRVHKKCSESLLRVLNAIWEAAGRDQAVVDSWGASIYGGAYNFRLMRGGNSLSMHSWGCAIDLNPAANGLGDATPDFDNHPEVMKAFSAEGWEWGGSWSKRDGMHWQAAWTRAGGVKWTPKKGVSKLARLLSLPAPELPPPQADDVDPGPEAGGSLEALEPNDMAQLGHALIRIPPFPDDAKFTESKNDPVVYWVQSMLDYWGWSEVGTVDGLMGGRTEGAILSYRNEHKPKLLPLVSTVDQDLVDALVHGPQRTVSISRANTTAADLKAEGEQTVVTASNVQKAGVGLGFFSLLGGADQQGAIDKAKSVVDGAGAAQEISERALDVVQWVAQKWWVPVLLLSGFIIWKAWGVIEQRVADHRSGKNTAL